MEKLDLSVNIQGHFLFLGDTQLQTPHRQIDLTNQSESRNLVQGPVLSSFREKRDVVLQHRANQRYIDTVSQDRKLDHSASKVMNLESEWNEQKRSLSQTRISSDTNQFSCRNYQKREGSNEPKLTRNTSDYYNMSSRNSSRLNISHQNESTGKYDGQRFSSSTWNLNVPLGSPVANTTSKSDIHKANIEKLNHKKSGEAANLNSSDINENRPGLKHKLNILDKILSKESNYPSSRTTPMSEVPLKCPVQPNKLYSNEGVLKDGVANSKDAKLKLKVDFSNKSNLTTTKSPKDISIRPKLSNRSPSGANPCTPSKSKENVTVKKSLKYQNKIISPIFVQVNLSDYADANTKENKYSGGIKSPKCSATSMTSPLTTPSAKSSKVKKSLPDGLKSNEKTQTVSEFKINSLNSKVLKFRDLNHNIEPKPSRRSDQPKVLKNITYGMKNFKEHLFEMNIETKHNAERLGLQTCREHRIDSSSRKEQTKQLEVATSIQINPKMNERDRLYQHIVQRLCEEKE